MSTEDVARKEDGFYQGGKPEVEKVEQAEESIQGSLTPEHVQYLIERHGTADLDPLPEMDDADPLNWPQWKKIVNLTLVAFHAFMSTFTAAAILSAAADIAKDLGVSPSNEAYLTSLVICILGVAPLIWRPLSQRFGRRPIFLLSLVCSLVGNIGCVYSPTYSTVAVCRAVVGFFISPAASIGSGVVGETFFRHERARFIGAWSSMVTLGVPVAPLIFGFVAMRVNYHWIYKILAITNGVQFVLYFFLGPETRYVRGSPVQNRPSSAFKAQYLNFRRIDPTPLRFADFVAPLKMALLPCVIIPSAAQSMIFLWASVMLSIEMPILYAEKFGFNTQQVGLQNISLLVGTIIGDQMGGVLSDKWMGRRQKKGKVPHPEFRLWLGYFGYLLVICGMVVFMCQLQKAKSWDITPLIGVGIAAAGNQLVTTVLMTYAVDCYNEEAASVGVFMLFVRQVWGFIGPFWFPDMINEVGMAKSSGVVVALIVGVAIIPTIALQMFGYKWHR